MRRLPTVKDRDRIAAARFMAEKLCYVLRLKNPHPFWYHHFDSNGKIISTEEMAR